MHLLNLLNLKHVLLESEWDARQGLWLTNAYLNCKRFLPVVFYLPAILSQDDMAPEELLFEFPSEAAIETERNIIYFCWINSIISCHFETCSSLKRGWDNATPAIHGGPVSPDSQQPIAT